MTRTRAAALLSALAFTALACGSDPEPAAQPELEPEPTMDAGQDAPEGEEDVEAPPQRPGCQNGYDLPVNTGHLSDNALEEVSGIVPSGHDPGVLWVHNDSGDLPRIFAINTRGELLGEVRLPAPAVDWEDIAAGTCPDGSGPCLWVGDIGDNGQVRPFVSVYVFPEPEVSSAGPFQPIELDAITHHRFTYPGGANNAEGMVVLPDGTGVFIFEKVGGDTARLFGHTGPVEEEVVTELELITTIEIPGPITGADLHPSGTRLLLRTYGATFEYVMDEGQTLADLAEISRTLVGGVHSEPQGEAVCYSADGASFFTISEQRRQAVKQYRCAACDDGDVCTTTHTADGTQCTGTLAEDEFESDAVLDGAELSRLDICPSSRSILAIQDVDDAEDWFKIDHVSDCEPYVRLANFGDDTRQVCAWFQCENGELPAVGCLEGERDGEAPEGTQGCCAEAPGQSTGSVRMDINCGEGGDQVGTLHARVRGDTAVGCGLYELTRGNF